MKSVVIMIVYAILLVSGGLTAFVLAPEGANAVTALLVPGACAGVMLVCGVAVMATAKTNLRAARVWHFAAVILALVFACAFAARGSAANLSAQRYKQASFAFDAAVKAGAAQNTPEARRAFFEQYTIEQGIKSGKLKDEAGARAEYLKKNPPPDHDKTYLANTLWALVFVSAGAFLGLLVTRPKGRAAPHFSTDAARE